MKAELVQEEQTEIKKTYPYARPYFDPPDVLEFRQLCLKLGKKPKECFRHLLDIEVYFREELPKKLKQKKEKKVFNDLLVYLKKVDPAKYHNIVEGLA